MIERNPITGEPALIVPLREERPNVFDGAPCPFCPGAERETPPEIARDGEPWRIRVFANRYPPTGHAEVVVESARHDDTFDALATEHAQRVVEMTFQRYHALARTSDYVCIFKNHGRMAGASIPHLHSQIVGLPFLPPRIATERAAFAAAVRCPLCDPGGQTVVGESEHYRVVLPLGARLAYQHWIVPKAHESEIGHPNELASLMQRSVGNLRTVTDAFNWSFIQFPREPRGHWYLEIEPRSTMIAGLELGTGTFVNSVDAAAAARILTQRHKS